MIFVKIYLTNIFHSLVFPGKNFLDPQNFFDFFEKIFDFCKILFNQYFSFFNISRQKFFRLVKFFWFFEKFLIFVKIYLTNIFHSLVFPGKNFLDP